MSYPKNTLRFLLLIVSVAILTTGCSQTKDTKTASTPQIGILDMNKAIKAHSRYGEVAKLEQQANALVAKANAQANAAARSQSSVGAVMPDMATITSGINTALEQEFNAKMADKHTQLTAGLKAKAEQLHSSLSAELQAYGAELDKTYQPRVFNIQLQLKTVQLSKEEMASLQSELESLQNERGSKLAAKDQELKQKMDREMVPEQAAIEQQLATYAEQLHAELAQKGAQQTNEIASRNQQQALTASQPVLTGNSELEQQVAAKQSEIAMLQQLIVDDIRNKAGKIAVERGLEAIMLKVKVNANAVDITGEVISQFSAPNIRLQ